MAVRFLDASSGALRVAAWCGPSTVLRAAQALGSPLLEPAPAVPVFSIPAALRSKPPLWPVDATPTRLSPERARELLLANVSPQGTRPGTVIAATSRDRPNYHYHWVRDGALVMATVLNFYENAPDDALKRHYQDVFQEYVYLTRHHQLTKTPSGDAERRSSGKDTVNLSDLGEPKFEVDGAAFTGSWGRPQDDGPALRAVTLIYFANALLDRGETAFVKRFLYQARLPARSAIKADLEHVSHHWRGTSFDLWEEISGHHFYTRLAQVRALTEGAALARRLSDPDAAAWYEGEALKLKAEIDRHWDAEAGYLKATLNRDSGIDWKASGLDVSVVLAVLHASGDDGFFSVTDDRVLATAQCLIDAFRALYPINRDELPGTVIGRYPEDRFDPAVDGSAKGNGWVLATAALGELFLRAAAEFKRVGRIEVTARNVRFFNFALNEAGKDVRLNAGMTLFSDSADFTALTDALKNAGQNQIRRIYYHANPDGSLSEQIHRETGHMHAAPNLTWSYAAFLSAVDALKFF
jgi:glucoamylase